MTSSTDEVVRKLDILVRLVAIAVCADKTQKEKIKILAGAGLMPKDIANFVGTTPNTVSVALSTMRRAGTRIKGGSPKRKQKQAAMSTVPDPAASER